MKDILKEIIYSFWEVDLLRIIERENELMNI
jgi:hypothetical protein